MTDDAPQTLSYQTLYPSRPPDDRKGGLIAFGTITIVIGALSGCMSVFFPLAQMAPMSFGKHHEGIGVVVSVTLIYLVTAVALISVGIGPVRRRRWVRPVVLAVTAQIIAVGVLTSISMGVMFPRMTAASPAGAALPAAAKVGMAVGLGLIFVMLVVVPVAYILFYRSEQVRSTPEFDDPVARWTDDVPIPVLGVTLALLGWGILEIVSAPTARMPAFGTVSSGTRAILVFLVTGAVALLLARLPASLGWLVGTALLLVVVAGMVATNLRRDRIQLYANAGYTEAEQNAIKQFNGDGLPAAISGTGFLILEIGYLVWVRRYYFTAPKPGSSESHLLPTCESRLP